MATVLDMVGKRVGRLMVVERAKNSKSGQARWVCECECGKKSIVLGYDLRSGKTRSCGCLQKEKAIEAHLTHGMRKTPTYISWAGIKNRCTNHSYHGYKNYGGRGISVCERWNKFENFYEDMGEKPKGLSVERKDNNGNYCPENCCWETIKNQNRNKRSNVNIEYHGKTQCMKDWAKELGINYGTLKSRLKTHSPQIAFNM